MKNIILLLLILTFGISGYSQELDSSSAKSKEYPYILPILGQKVYDRGYSLPLPFSLSFGTVFNKQGIILEDFTMAFTQGDEIPDFDQLQPISDLIVFGPSEGRINTGFVRAEAWILPFLSIGGYAGKVYGEQTVTLTSPIEISSVTEIDGQYYGLNLAALAPVGPVILQADYSWSWTTNKNLSEPVLVKVSGMRVLKRFVNPNKEGRFFTAWVGAQTQKLGSQTSGSIALEEALNIDEGFEDDLDMRWEEYKMGPEYGSLSPAEKIKADAAYALLRSGVENLTETTVHYTFNKRLEYEWNMVIGGNYTFNKKWALRAEYGFLKSKQSLMVNLAYSFGL